MSNDPKKPPKEPREEEDDLDRITEEEDPSQIEKKGINFDKENDN